MASTPILHLSHFLLLLSPFFCSRLAAPYPHSVVDHLPGFQGPLPFYLETGYIGLGESEDVQLFYYFVRSQNDPKNDPLMLWLTGGPGCSGFTALAYQFGPVSFKIEYSGGLPNLVSNPNTWTKVSSIIFIDSPVGTGFSYPRTPAAAYSSDSFAASQLNEFSRKWLKDHPEFISNTFYVGGDSYSGFIAPPTFLKILEGNDEGMQPTVNLEGYLLGNPITDRFIEGNYAIPFTHGMALISDELYESMKKNCKENYVNIDFNNKLCLEDVRTYNTCIEGIYRDHILEPTCPFASPKPSEFFANTRSLNSIALPHPIGILSQQHCRNDRYLLCKYFLNNKTVQEALHIRKGTIRKLERCNPEIRSRSNLYKHDIPSSIHYHADISKKGYKSLIYSGDHDLTVPFISTEHWIKSLSYSIIDDWRSWKYMDSTAGLQIAGYTRTYSNRMTFATVKGAGHTAAEYKPEACIEMFKRWISNKPL